MPRGECLSRWWAVQRSEGLSWSNITQYPFRRRSHINIQETRAFGALSKRVPPQLPLRRAPRQYGLSGGDSEGAEP